MTDTKQQGFKTLLQEERERNAKPVTVPGVNRAWWKREKSHWNSCPHVEEFVCAPSKKYRKLGPFLCSGSWHETCGVFMRIRNNEGDPSVLALEG